jgi:hypothetical protein
MSQSLTKSQFANVHDVSWGTKGDNKVSTDLGVVSAGKGDNKNEVEVAVPTAETDINAAYEDAMQRMKMLCMSCPRNHPKRILSLIRQRSKKIIIRHSRRTYCWSGL